MNHLDPHSGTGPSMERPRYTIEEFVAAITPENVHCEIDFGPPVGNEIW